MKYEQPQIKKHLSVAQINSIQVALTRESLEPPVEWLEANGALLREIFQDFEVEIFELYEHDPVAAQKYVMEKLHNLKTEH